MKVTYWYSACVTIETPEARILCDPWFTDGAYDGSWFHWPEIDWPVIETLGKHDVIYISHVHPDHYDPVFLRQYLDAYPDAEVWIPEGTAGKVLSLRMTADGLPYKQVRIEHVGPTTIHLEPASEDDRQDIDSGLVVRRHDHAVVNANDMPWARGANYDRLRDLAGGRCDVALVGYTPAGAYPQCYSADEEWLQAVAEAKAEGFLQGYTARAMRLRADLHMPFAGQYVLGGRHHNLNRYRGVVDAVVTQDFDPRAVVVHPGGYVEDGEVTGERRKPHSISGEYDAKVRRACMTYEHGGEVNLSWGQVRQAYERAQSRSDVEADYWFCFYLPNGEWVAANARKGRDELGVVTGDREGLRPRQEIVVDPRHLVGLLDGTYHWNNCEVGSHWRVRLHHPEAFASIGPIHWLNYFGAPPR